MKKFKYTLCAMIAFVAVIVSGGRVFAAYYNDFNELILEKGEKIFLATFQVVDKRPAGSIPSANEIRERFLVKASHLTNQPGASQEQMTNKNNPGSSTALYGKILGVVNGFSQVGVIYKYDDKEKVVPLVYAPVLKDRKFDPISWTSPDGIDFSLSFKLDPSRGSSEVQLGELEIVLGGSVDFFQNLRLLFSEYAEDLIETLIYSYIYSERSPGTEDEIKNVERKIFSVAFHVFDERPAGSTPSADEIKERFSAEVFGTLLGSPDGITQNQMQEWFFGKVLGEVAEDSKVGIAYNVDGEVTAVPFVYAPILEDNLFGPISWTSPDGIDFVLSFGLYPDPYASEVQFGDLVIAITSPSQGITGVEEGSCAVGSSEVKKDLYARFVIQDNRAVKENPSSEEIRDVFAFALANYQDQHEPSDRRDLGCGMVQWLTGQCNIIQTLIGKVGKCATTVITYKGRAIVDKPFSVSPGADYKEDFDVDSLPGDKDIKASFRLDVFPYPPKFNKDAQVVALQIHISDN